MINVTLPYPPALNRMYRTFNNRIILSASARTYKAMVKLKAFGISPYMKPNRLVVEVILWRPRKSGDLDGFLKAAFDSMNGVLWEDDSQVVEIHAYRLEDKLNPRMDITVWPEKPK